MRIDLVASEDWDHANEAVASVWPLNDGESARVHAGLGAAAFECVLSLAQVYSHRRSVAVVKGNSPAFDHVVPWLLRETYQMQSTTWSQLTTAEARSAWVASLKPETAFALVVEDHPFTGALSPADELDALLNDRKTFVIRVSHSSFVGLRNSLRPMSWRLCSIDDGLAVSIAGQRIRITPAFSHRQPWDAEDVAQRLRARLATPQSQTAIEALEAAFAASRLLSEGTPRLFDRAVLAFPDVSGEALRSRLAAVGSIETANLCRWDSTRLFRGWWENAPSEDLLRGLVAVPSILCERKDFATELRAAYEGLRNLSTW